MLWAAATKFSYADRRKPPVVKASELPAAKEATPRDFVRENKDAAVKLGGLIAGCFRCVRRSADLPVPVRAAAEARQRREDEDQSYLKKEDYGRVPAYLDDVKREIERERELVRQLVEERQQEEARRVPQMRQLPEEERQQARAARAPRLPRSVEHGSVHSIERARVLTARFAAPCRAQGQVGRREPPVPVHDAHDTARHAHQSAPVSRGAARRGAALAGTRMPLHSLLSSVSATWINPPAATDDRRLPASCAGRRSSKPRWHSWRSRWRSCPKRLFMYLTD